MLGKYDYSDLKNVELNLGLEDELCQIIYSEEYKKLLGILRGLISEDEKSERAIFATKLFISSAPAYYTAWNYLFNIIKELYGKDAEKLNKELEWLDDLTERNPKNYQIWSFRQALLKLHPAPAFSRELPIIQLMIDEDSKNYHVWSYRRWAVLFFGDFSKELDFVKDLIAQDVYNNSAWSHRFFVFKNVGIQEADFNDELDYLRDKIRAAPQNVSSWNYLKGLYNQFRDESAKLDEVDFALEFVNGVMDISDDHEMPKIQSSYALEFLAEVYSIREDTHSKARKAYELLCKFYDPIRKNYWEHLMKSLE